MKGRLRVPRRATGSRSGRRTGARSSSGRMSTSSIAGLGAHLIDLALWMVGEIEEVAAQSETFTRERSGRAVDVDEASSVLARFVSGARGVFEMARVCARRPCDFFVEVNGTAG